MIRLFNFALLALLAGCVSTEMKGYMGKDIREVVLVNGPPINELDMGGGVRAFQFKWGGGTIVVPQTSRTTGQVNTYGNTAVVNATTTTTGGQVIHNEGCTISYLTKWSEERQGWVIFDYRYPKQLVC
ncbi:hypothetical protein [Hydrogenophaga defluvii]|uniref:Lipoprotein n=1 Tax=Hydrogenophaga defluvii TaxID=249410 RepID=A0ABW2S7F6_9BURK